MAQTSSSEVRDLLMGLLRSAIDKILIGAIALVVGLIIQASWNDRQDEMERRRAVHAYKIDVGTDNIRAFKSHITQTISLMAKARVGTDEERSALLDTVSATLDEARLNLSLIEALRDPSEGAAEEDTTLPAYRAALSRFVADLQALDIEDLSQRRVMDGKLENLRTIGVGAMKAALRDMGETAANL